MTGLAGAGLVLHSSLGDDLAITANGAFTFATTAAQAESYAVTVAQQPASPWQTCAVANGTGTMGAADVTNVAVTCTVNSYPLGGTVTGLAAGGTLVLQNNGADDTTITANGSFVLAPVASGGAYSVTVLGNPADQTCTVANGTGTVASAAVTNIEVTCGTVTYAIGGTVSGLVGSGLVLRGQIGTAAEDLAVAANGGFVFVARASSGANIEITVQTQPSAPAQTCTVANGTRTVGTADITDVAVSCSSARYSVGGTVTGLAGAGLVLHGSSGEDLPVAADGAFTFPTKLDDGAPYAVTVLAQPSERHCSIANGSGIVAGADVTNVAVTCGAVIQRWVSPATWGALWPDGPTMLQHAYFDGTGLVSAKGPALGWLPDAGGAEPAPVPFTGFPSGTRHGVGPYTNGHYQGPVVDGLALSHDMLVCAIVKPDHDPVLDVNGTEKTIIGKGIARGVLPVFGGGWVLMQMHHHWCFHYQSTDGTVSEFNMAATPTYFADHDQVRNGPLNPSYVVVCGGRAGDQVVIAANSADTELVTDPLPAGSRLDAGLHPLTIGGSDTSDPAMQFGGRVYETAVWSEPATLANIRAKFAAIQGLTLPDGSIARYSRNREGPFIGADGKYHTTWRSGPRIDPAKGFLFGLQGWNRVVTEYIPTDPNQASRFIATGEALDEWVLGAGATLDANATAVPPGDSEFPSARLVSLAAGASMSTVLARNISFGFESTGLLHGQVWIRVPSAQTGTLTVQVTNPAPGGSDRFNIDLGGLAPDTWTRFWLRRAPGGQGNELTATGGAGQAGSVRLRNEGTTPISFWAWGLDLTQIGGGGDLGNFDPGPEMFEGSLRAGDFTAAIDVLQLPTLADSTAATGYCLSVDAQPPPNLSWTAPFAKQRTLLSWVKDAQSARLTAEPVTGMICFGVTGAGTRPCFPPNDPGLAWAPGSKHNVKGCVSAAGDVSIYADNVRLGAPVAGATAVDLAGGRLVVGGDLGGLTATPWHGYVPKALACFNTGSAAACE